MIPSEKIVGKAAVLGAGSWGTALAQIAAAHAGEVVLWSIEDDVVGSVNARHESPRYLPGVALDPAIKATASLEEALRDAGAVISVLPTVAVGPVFERAASLIQAGTPVISATKGICAETLRFPSRIIADALRRSREEDIFVLSGPSFALEAAQKLPTAVTFAGPTMEAAETWGRLFFMPHFRTYPSTDAIGVQTAGALKNVIALAAGAVDGLRLGNNARAALMTRGLGEITKVGLHYGADPMTFLGLSGMGDLLLTCTGGLSRNRSLGGMLAAGKSLADGLKELGHVAEGVTTAKSAHRLMKETGLDLPICARVYEVLFEGKPAQRAIMELMSRPMHPEHEPRA